MCASLVTEQRGDRYTERSSGVQTPRSAGAWCSRCLFLVPCPGACSGTRPSASFPLCKHVEQAPVGRSSHPFRQKYLLLKCWVCSWLKLFREFAVTETRVCLFFARYGTRLVKNGDLLFVTGTARVSQFVSWSLQKQSRDLQLEILALIYCSRCPDTAFYPETRVNRPAKM